MWIAIGGIALVLVILLIVMAARGGGAERPSCEASNSLSGLCPRSRGNRGRNRRQVTTGTTVTAGDALSAPSEAALAFFSLIDAVRHRRANLNAASHHLPEIANLDSVAQALL